MDFMTSIRFCLSNYTSIEGRAQRSQYWWFILFMLIVYVIAALLDVITQLPVFSLIAMLGLLIPSITAGVRRLHDLDKSGWWILISVIPIVSLYLIYLFAQSGTSGDNQYGADPLG